MDAQALHLVAGLAGVLDGLLGVLCRHVLRMVERGCWGGVVSDVEARDGGEGAAAAMRDVPESAGWGDGQKREEKRRGEGEERG